MELLVALCVVGVIYGLLFFFDSFFKVRPSGHLQSVC